VRRSSEGRGSVLPSGYGRVGSVMAREWLLVGVINNCWSLVFGYRLLAGVKTFLARLGPGVAIPMGVAFFLRKSMWLPPYPSRFSG
jgi:hypothetical protein